MGHVGMIICLVLAASFGLLAVLFTCLGEKGAMLISGFNTLPEEERKKYDKKRMCREQRNAFALWCLICLAGGILSRLLGGYMAVLALAVWLIVFFKDVHIDAKKAFARYKFEENV